MGDHGVRPLVLRDSTTSKNSCVAWRWGSSEALEKEAGGRLSCYA